MKPQIYATPAVKGLSPHDALKHCFTSLNFAYMNENVHEIGLLIYSNFV